MVESRELRASAKNASSERIRRAGSRKSLSRAEKARLTREALLSAAASVVGEVGYADAMVSAITSKAQVAQGTFYNYFESRQQLFDQLLPHVGRDMLDFIQLCAASARNELEREEMSFRAFFAFLISRPEFYRILYEAEVFAPAAFRQHIETVAAGYVRVLKRARAHGEMDKDQDEHLEDLAYMLMGARNYLCMRHARDGGKGLILPERVVEAYMALVTKGMYTSKAGEARSQEI